MHLIAMHTHSPTGTIGEQDLQVDLQGAIQVSSTLPGLDPNRRVSI